MKNRFLVSVLAGIFFNMLGYSQTIIIDTLQTTLGDTNEIVWLRVPANYDSTIATPLLFGWHQLEGDHLEFGNATLFDEEADDRCWLAASMRGPISTHWTNHAAQSHCVDVLNWIADRYNVDHTRIYMVGGSMGGAAGMVFHNNHLDPSGWMVAAIASGSGIMDCHRRFVEQGYNLTMVEAFGGTPTEVPYQYHHNSAIHFADSTQSMHVNLRHLPMYYTYGYGESPWSEYAVDLYNVIHPIADSVHIVEAVWPGHGWQIMNEHVVCDWLENFTLNDNPDDISINADEDGRYYWIYVNQWDSTDAFTRFDAAYDSLNNSFSIHGWWNLEWAILDLDMMGIDRDSIVQIDWIVEDTLETLMLPGYPTVPDQVLRNGSPTTNWTYDAFWQIISIFSDTGHSVWEIHPHPTSVPSGKSSVSLGAGDLIRQTFPNPFNPILRISYQVATPGYVRVKVYDILGRDVITIAEGFHSSGIYRTSFDGHNHSSGIYIIRMESHSSVHAMKVLLIK